MYHDRVVTSPALYPIHLLYDISDDQYFGTLALYIPVQYVELGHLMMSKLVWICGTLYAENKIALYIIIPSTFTTYIVLPVLTLIAITTLYMKWYYAGSVL